MKRVVLSVLLAMSAALPAVQAAPVQLVVRSPELVAAVGTGADLGNGALDATFSATGGITLTEFVWWGYHMPKSSIDQFEITLNGTLVGSQSVPLGTISSLDTGETLTDVAAPGFSVELIRYTLQFAPGVVTAAGTNTVSILNEESSAEWRWQGLAGSLADAGESAFAVTGDVTQQVPEPAGLVLVLSALAAAAAARRRA